LNAVQFDMLCLENKIMIHGQRTWVRHSRFKECTLLQKFYNRHISKSWLDDNRGALKRKGYHRAWQHGFRHTDGTYDGSESRRQFTLRACYELASRGIKVFRRVWHAVKKGIIPPTPTTPQVVKSPGTDNQNNQPQTGNPFLDPEYRKKKGFKPFPPITKS
jgi:hypothetical protein